jgi:hypothetical protein
MNSDNTLFRDEATLENVAGCAGERNLIFFRALSMTVFSRSVGNPLLARQMFQRE